MPTKMHRLQISLPERQVQFLAELAKREGVSMAEIVRRILSREAEAAREGLAPESLLDIVGIAEDPGPFIPGKPVSEYPELYMFPTSTRKPSDKG